VILLKHVPHVKNMALRVSTPVLVTNLEPGLPHVELSSAVLERIKAVVVKRYDDNSKALDFSRLHTDPCERMV
jgi:hypothetical protein